MDLRSLGGGAAAELSSCGAIYIQCLSGGAVDIEWWSSILTLFKWWC